jgi:hypothetical protein
MSPLLFYTLPALGGYVMLSIFFLRRPRLLHTPLTPAFRARLAAHRGGELGWRGGERLAAFGATFGVRPERQVPPWAAQSKGVGGRC